MKRNRGWRVWLAVAFVLFAVAATIRVGCTADEKGYNPPTLWDGKTPDFRGLWETRSTAYVNIEGHPAMGGVAASKSIIVDPANGKIPYKPGEAAKRDENYKNRATADPANKCYETGIPRSTYLPMPFQIVQSPGNFAIVYQENHSLQIVYPDSKPHFEGIDWWMGDSRGHWEGNTYVVDVTTLNADAWFDEAGNHHSDNMHVVERFTRTGPDTLQLEARIEDPDTFTQPWTIRTTLYRITKPGAMIMEDECLDDVETGLRHRISPTDPKNLLKNDYRRWDKAAASVPADKLVAPEPPAPKVTVAANIPRLPNGHPDLNGLWYKAGGFGTGAPAAGGGGGRAGAGGGRGAATATPTGLGAAGAGGGGAAAAGGAGGGGGRGAGGRGRGAAGAGGAAAGGGGAPGGGGQPGGDASTSFRGAGVPKVPYTAAGFLEMEWRGSHAFLDGEPRCHLAGVPRAAQQPPYPHQIIEDENTFTIMYEYVHEPRIVPLDGSAHPKGYWAWDGDSRGHWEGDTLVIDVSNFNGRSWLDMSGNFVDENEHVVERYTMTDPNTMLYEATITDPVIFSRPWTMRMTIKRQPDKDQILEYGCLEGEQDRQHYTEEWGGRNTVVVKNGELLKTGGVAPPPPPPAAPTDEESINGCLRSMPNGAQNAYTLTMPTGNVHVSVADPEMDKVTQPLLDREVRFWGKWDGDKSKKMFSADRVRVTAEGCASTDK